MMFFPVACLYLAKTLEAPRTKQASLPSHADASREKISARCRPWSIFRNFGKNLMSEDGRCRWLTGKKLQSADGGKMKGMGVCSRKNELR